MAETNEMHPFASRLQTFQIPHQLNKRRTSSQAGSKKKGAGNTVEWPHSQPAPEDLARAGFFYRPAQESHDNVQCFHCSVKLDGWEASDDPLQEHLAHSASCHWAQSLRAGITAQRQQGNTSTMGDDNGGQDPMSEELLAARRGTFETGAGWPHENKRGWKCKVTKMIEAGWCFDPAPITGDEEADGVTCFYCNLSLDGWEPKDDPLVEHKRREPDCAFFQLVERFGSASEMGKKTKGKGRAKAAARNSAASKASRFSTASVQSLLSDAPSLVDVAASEDAAVDDSIVSTASQATITGTTKGKKKGGRPKAAAKGTKGRSRAGTVDSTTDAGALYPDLSSQVESQPAEREAVDPSSQPESAPLPAKKTRKDARQSKQQLDSSVVEISSLDMPPPKKTTRARKAKPQPEPEPETAGDAGADADIDNSQVSAQLQEELERSMDMDMDMDIQAGDATPQPEPAKAKRGVKRTSDGLKKQQEDEAVGGAFADFPVPPKAGPAPKGKKGRKPSKQAIAESEGGQPLEIQDDVPVSESEPEPKLTKSKQPAAKKGGRGKKASSTRSSRSSKATIVADTEPTQDAPEDLDQDEREIEAELQRIAAEEAMQAEQDKTAEFELSPFHAQKHATDMRNLENELKAEVTNDKIANSVAPFATTLEPRSALAAYRDKVNATPSPSGSDKENQPSSILQPSAKHPTVAAPILSPTKTARIPLAPGTPNRLSPSKSRAQLLSPSKQISQLTSSQPWEAVDLDSILLASPQPTPGTLSQRLAGAVAALTSPEKGLTVEEWVRFQAEKSEKQLRQRCEEMVGAFETEGMKGVASLEGIPVIA